MTRYFKFVTANLGAVYGYYQYRFNRWSPLVEYPWICHRGYHAAPANGIFEWSEENLRLFEVEVRGEGIGESPDTYDQKRAFTRMKLVKEYVFDEKLCTDYYNWIVSRFGDVPAKIHSRAVVEYGYAHAVVLPEEYADIARWAAQQVWRDVESQEEYAKEQLIQRRWVEEHLVGVTI